MGGVTRRPASPGPGDHALTFGRFRTATLDVAGLAFLVYAADQLHHTAGAAAAGLALLLLAHRGDPDADPDGA